MNGITAAVVVRLTSEPETRYLPDGKELLRLNGKAEDGKAGPDTPPEWVQATVWGERAEELRDALHKGDSVYMEGRLKLKTWTGQDGQPRCGLELSAWTCQPIGLIGRNAPAYRQKVAEGGRDIVAPARQSPSSPVTADAGGALACQDCGALLEPVTFRDGTTWSVDTLASYGRRKYGRVLCMACYKQAKALAASGPAPLPAPAPPPTVGENADGDGADEEDIPYWASER